MSLDLYRQESKKIIGIFQRRVVHAELGTHVGADLTDSATVWPRVLALEDNIDPKIIVEKASIDESFFDLSLYTRRQLLHRFPYLDVSPESLPHGLDTPLPPPPADIRDELDCSSWEALGIWEADDSPLSWTDICIALGAERLIAVRKCVYDRLGYTTCVCANRFCWCFDKQVACESALLLTALLVTPQAMQPNRASPSFNSGISTCVDTYEETFRSKSRCPLT